MLSYTWAKFPGLPMAGQQAADNEVGARHHAAQDCRPLDDGGRRGRRDCGNPAAEEPPKQECQAGAHGCHQQVAENPQSSRSRPPTTPASPMSPQDARGAIAAEAKPLVPQCPRKNQPGEEEQECGHGDSGKRLPPVR